VVTPRASAEFGACELKLVDDEHVTQDQLTALVQKLFTGLLKPAKVQKYVNDSVRAYNLSKRLACFDRIQLEVMLSDFLNWMVETGGDSNLRITRKSMLNKLKSLHGWKIGLLKRPIESMFENSAKAVGAPIDNGIASLGKQELAMLIRKLVEGSVKLTDIISQKKVVKLFL